MLFKKVQFFTVFILLASSGQLLMTHAVAANIAPSQANTSFDQQLDKIRELYPLSEGWSLSLRAPSSLSSIYGGWLADVDRRWGVHREPSLSDGESKGNALGPQPTGIKLNVDMIDNIKQQYGNEASLRIATWQKLSQARLGLNADVKLTQVNNFFNGLAFKSDEDNWGMDDYWTSPVEFLINNSGDCEDYAIAKYFTLKAMGFPIDRLRITYVTSTQLTQPHMVLAYYEQESDDPLILDNLSPYVLHAKERRDLTPIHSFNG